MLTEGVAPRPLRAVRVLASLTVAGLGVYVALLVTHLTTGGGPGVSAASWLSLGVMAASALLCLARAALVGEERGAWLAVGAGLGLWAAEDAWWQVALDPARDPNSCDRLRAVEELRTAVGAGQMVVHYQPVCDLATGDVRGVEALVRWAHPVRGLVYPDAFLPLAERVGLMHRLTLVVLEAALRQCRSWRDAGLPLTVAVNLSVPTLVDARLPGDVARLLAAADLPPSALELELTEDMLLADPARGQEVLDRLHALGVGVAIDDFGTGYSSLAYLRQLTVDRLKLDRSFVTDMATDPALAAIVRASVDLAHSLGLEVVAEGVETQVVWDQLVAFGCDTVQGYHLSHPLPADRLTSWLEERRGPLVALADVEALWP